MADAVDVVDVGAPLGWPFRAWLPRSLLPFPSVRAVEVSVAVGGVEYDDLAMSFDVTTADPLLKKTFVQKLTSLTSFVLVAAAYAKAGVRSSVSVRGDAHA